MSQTEVCTCTDFSGPALQYCPTVGRDTTGNFALSYKGMAVRSDCNRFIAFRPEKGKPKDVHLYDVSGLTLPGCDSLVYRVPVTDKQVKVGDLILISDCPFDVLYVTGIEGIGHGQLEGVTASGAKETVIVPKRLGDCARFTRIYSVFDALEIKPDELTEEKIAYVAAVLCCGGPGKTTEFLSALLANDLAGILKGGRFPLLLALQQSQCLESFILTRALQGDLDQKLPNVEPEVIKVELEQPVKVTGK